MVNGFELILPFLRPIQHLILDPDISEIMINGPERIFIEKAVYFQPVPGSTGEVCHPSWTFPSVINIHDGGNYGDENRSQRLYTWSRCLCNCWRPADSQLLGLLAATEPSVYDYVIADLLGRIKSRGPSPVPKRSSAGTTRLIDLPKILPVPNPRAW